jgi:hypothetical protein
MMGYYSQEGNRTSLCSSSFSYKITFQELVQIILCKWSFILCLFNNVYQTATVFIVAMHNQLKSDNYHNEDYINTYKTLPMERSRKND